MWRRRYWESEERYLRLFSDAVDATFVGDASTAYAKLPIATGVPARIERFSPGARYIYVIRDPVERSISHYWHMVTYEAETRRMLDAVRQDPTFIAYSHYAMQLKAYLEIIDRHRLCVLTFENLVRDPERELRRLYSWLGVDPNYVPAKLKQPENVTPPVIYQATGFGWLQRLRQSRHAARVGPWVHPQLKSVLARLATVKVPRQSVSIDETVRYLRPIQRAQTLELSELLQRNFTEWTTLWGSNSH